MHVFPTMMNGEACCCCSPPRRTQELIACDGATMVLRQLQLSASPPALKLSVLQLLDACLASGGTAAEQCAAQLVLAKALQVGGPEGTNGITCNSLKWIMPCASNDM